MITLCLPVSASTITLRLSTDIDLLVLDGKKVSSSLLRGANSAGLDNGPRQLVFCVERTTHLSNNERRLHISPPLVIGLNTQLINQVDSRLPHLENEREANHFDAAPHLKLLDGDTTPTPVKLDILAITPTVKAINYEVEAEHYSKSAKRASLPQFATIMADDSTLPSGVSELDAIPSQSQVLTGQRLKYRFKLTDLQTRNTFLQWAEKQSSS